MSEIIKQKDQKREEQLLQQQREQQKDSAALRIQRVWRGLHVRKFERPKRLEEAASEMHRIRSDDASTRISCFFRSIVAKKSISHLQRLRDAEIIQQEKIQTCILIQSLLRYRRSRTVEFSMKRFHPIADRAQRILSRNIRGFLARAKHGNIRRAFERYNGFRKCNDAAAVIQALVRGVQTRSRMEAAVGALQVESRVPEGAVIFQRVGRAFVARNRVSMMLVEQYRLRQERRQYLKNLRKQHQPTAAGRSATTPTSDFTTSPFSGNVSPRGRSRSPSPVMIISTNNKKDQSPSSSTTGFSATRARKRKIILCQAAARRFLQRDTLFKLRMNRFQSSSFHLRNGCAVVIQKIWRGYLQRCRFEKERTKYRASLLMHAVVSAFLVRCYDLASLYHVKLSRDRIALEHRSATKIASIVRMFFAKKYVWGMNRLVLRIQRVCRAQKDRLYVSHLLRQRSATRIQRKVRAHLKRKHEKIRYELLRESLAAEQERNLAAVLIQSLARMFLARLKFHFTKGLNRIEQMKMRRIARRMVERHDERKRFREARENMLAKRVQHRWFGYTTQIRENFEILRLETKLEGITLRAMHNLERAHRIEIEEEFLAFVETMEHEVKVVNRKFKELISRMDHWRNEGQFVPSQMLRLYDAQRFARGVVARKMYSKNSSRGLFTSHQDLADDDKNERSLADQQTPRRQNADVDEKASAMDQMPSPIVAKTQESQILSSARRRFFDSSTNVMTKGNNNNTSQLMTKSELTAVMHELEAIREQEPISKRINNNNNQQPAFTSPPSSLPLAQRATVDLSHTYLSLEVMKNYFIHLRYSSVVRTLDVSHCSLGDDTASYLIEMCSGMRNLESLNLSHNPFTNVAATKILAWLESRPSKLKSVELSHTLVSRPYKRCIEGMVTSLSAQNDSEVSMVQQLNVLRNRVKAIETVYDDDD